ncbi:hypothetical protein G6F57_006543 [Rhizopus arrhizus]|uniref:Uncharacterized protein n=1 Tax=Rhizopus oryzae TaxID=64495 RepID=A0A9P7BS36_RHIOR|nr:hypothetical protein G6F23_010321 [Rhizopus arrhizus]KAG1413911.1 hypothetical protein G6F58_007236 [Rhizopus delemar]KAG0767583.1 hypothetical protein G6F24_002651 [Rhizopus arrhizus]KAG0797005.1 hypothetical protein G6F21_000857 [Rhizopus arrhizus]KAG0800347.1 hypothetical protein G6F22_002318 [Rhizopus arrhizus]
MRSFLILVTFALANLIGNNSAGVIKRGGGKGGLDIIPIASDNNFLNKNDILNKDKILKGNEILNDNGCGLSLFCKSTD